MVNSAFRERLVKSRREMMAEEPTADMSVSSVKEEAFMIRLWDYPLPIGFGQRLRLNA